ncbi:MAG: hypothetical protein OEY49_19500, partial [Candidatus Heimdallarchaeota archaeon]|nr:hypothetical protein [Candidatus Heimdallarchaeota archaeon]
MVEQFNLVSTNELPKLIFNGRIRELKPDSKVRILNTTVNIAIDQIFRNQNLQKIRLFVISHDFEGEIYVEPIKYDALFFKLGINQLSIKISRQFDDIFIEQQKIIESFLTKRYLDVVILINELMDNEKVELLAKDVFRLYCLQAHSLIKSGLIDKAETSLSMAKQILKELDPTELNNNWRENYSINNPLSESIFLDRGYLSGDEIYLLFLEIINGIAQPNYDVDIIQQKIQEGILQTQNSNIDYHLEFNFLSLLINNNGIALSEINKFKSCIKNSNKFFTLLVDGLSGGDIDENSLDLPLTEDLTGMIEEFKSNGIITRRMYHTNQSHINLSVESDFHYMDPIISDSKGRTIEDQEYSDLITTYFANLSGVDQILVRRLLFLGNIGKERYYQDDFDQARQIFLYLEREYIQLPPNFKKIIQGSKIKYENSLLLKNQIIDKNIIRIFDLGLVYLFVGMTCYQQKSFDKSMDYLNLCQIEYFNNKQREYATAYTIKGIIEFNLGNVDYSTEFFKLSLKYLLK